MAMEGQSKIPSKPKKFDFMLTEPSSYVVFDATTTNIYGWRNGATSNGPPAYWYAMNGVFSGLPPAHSLSGWRFVDLNGDKKDDRKSTWDAVPGSEFRH